MIRNGEMLTLQVQPEVRSLRWKSVYDQLYMDLGRHAYGDTFYSITAVCQRFDVSTITAIRALNELATRGLIEKIPGKGNIVRQVSEQILVRLVVGHQNPAAYHKHWPIAQRIIEGVSQSARQNAVDFDLMSGDHVSMLFAKPRKATGFLLFGAGDNLELKQHLRKHQFPFVLVDPFTRYEQDVHVRIDRFAAGYMAATHLLELGHRRIGFVTGNLRKPNFRDRLRGARRAMKQAGIPLDGSLIRQTGMDGYVAFDEDAAALDSLMISANPPTAIILGDDTRGIHLLEACRQRNVRVPDQLSMVSYPNNSEASLTTPAMSAMDACYEQAGAKALEILAKWMRNSEEKIPQQTLISPVLVQRQTTGPVPRG